MKMKWKAHSTLGRTVCAGLAFVASMAFSPAGAVAAAESAKPHIVFVMADDMGWGQTGYRGHPLLKTPHLDAMATAGLRFERFYAGAPVCSPTRASVLTGRANDRTGVLSHGYALRRQEKTIAQALKAAGYVTAHFGKWHLNGLRGPGVPVWADDEYHPGRFGFDEWLTASNFFDFDPLLSRMGKTEEFQGDSSVIVVDEAIEFFKRQRAGGAPLFAVIWYGTPHSPFKASDEDCAPFAHLDKESAHHYGELVAMDRSIGTLRAGLRDLGMADNTLLVFCSDNGGLPKIEPETVGGLRGNKGSVYEGGLRVPAILEWPSVIRPRVTQYPAATMDLFPTVADILGLPGDVFVRPVDGISLKPLFKGELKERGMPIPFRFGAQAAWIDNKFKLVTRDLKKGDFELYDLENDPTESKNLASARPDKTEELKQKLLTWNETVDASFAGKDYPGERLNPPDPEPVFWRDHPAYAPYLEAWQSRWEYGDWIRRTTGKSGSDEEKSRRKGSR